MTDIPTPGRRPSPAEIARALAGMTSDELAVRMAAAGAPAAPDHAALVAADPGLAEVGMRDTVIAGVHGDVPARLYSPPGPETDDRDAALVWVHGGAFISGDLDMPESHWVGLALAARGVPVLCVDYRKSIGGVHHPVPSDDVLDAWLWAAGHAADLGARPDRLHLGGASAGGALAAGVTKRLRDGAGRMPASLVLAYPTVHPQVPPPSDELRRALDKAPAGQGFFGAGGMNAMNLL